MRTGLYFPNVEVKSESIVRTALLMWDQLEFIVPWVGFDTQYRTPLIARAMELVGQPRTPTQKEQKEVHKQIIELLADGVPETFRYKQRAAPEPDDYGMWTPKLAPETWQFLVEEGLCGPSGDYDHALRKSAGLSLMSILADVLAGETRSRITDLEIAYATIANAVKRPAEKPSAHYVVPLTFKAVSVEEIPLERLIHFREKEAKEQSKDRQTLRHAYVAAVERHAANIARYAPGTPDRLEIDRIFVTDMERDFADLKRELGYSRRDAWLSKEFVTLAIAGAATVGAALAPPPFALPALIGGPTGAVSLVAGVAAAHNKFSKTRYEIMRKHPTAYLYQLA